MNSPIHSGEGLKKGSESVSSKWIAITDELPAEGELVDTKISDGNGERNFGQLKRKGNLWFLPDMSMYVYYTPTHWRRLTERK
ncbi:MAG: hypothetical protein ABFD25_03370 [Clostridiaceae bacterium]